MLEATGVECVRGERTLFSDMNFTLCSGGLLLVTGPNGSGKTSLLRMVCGLLMPASGRISWNGSQIREQPDAYHAELAYLGHLNAIKEELNAFENLEIATRLAGLRVTREKVADALSGFGLGDYDHLPCKLLSQGQKRRVALARLKLSASRSLWVLDEPFNALDAAGVMIIRSLLASHLAAGGIALLTTHQEVEVAAQSTQKIDLSS